MWRRFNFWERHAVEAPRDLLKHTWPCAVAGEAGSQAVGALFFGGNDGTLAVVEAARLRPVAGWRAHETRVTHLVHCNKARARAIAHRHTVRCANVELTKNNPLGCVVVPFFAAAQRARHRRRGRCQCSACVDDSEGTYHAAGRTCAASTAAT